MRKISKAAVDAFLKGVPMNAGNTQVTVMSDGSINMFLHANLIATRKLGEGYHDIGITFAGWMTRTTQERINALMEVLQWGKFSISTKEAEAYWVDKKGLEYTVTSREYFPVGKLVCKLT